MEAEKKQQLGSAAKYIKPLSVSTARKVISTEEGLLCAEMIREFLSFFKLDHTLGVFIPEMSLHADFPKSRDEMARECGFSKSQDDDSKPLILRLVEKVRTGDFGQPSRSEDFSNSP